MLPSSSSPWKPATTTTRPAARSARMRRSSMWMMRALLWDAVGADVHLVAGVRAREAAVRLQRHREQRDRHLLAGGEQDVELAGFGTFLNAARKVEQAVGVPAHRGDHDHDVVAPLAGACDLGGDVRDPFDAPDRRASELLNDQAHVRGTHDRAPPPRELLAHPTLDGPDGLVHARRIVASGLRQLRPPAPAPADLARHVVRERACPRSGRCSPSSPPATRATFPALTVASTTAAEPSRLLSRSTVSRSAFGSAPSIFAASTLSPSTSTA